MPERTQAERNADNALTSARCERDRHVTVLADVRALLDRSWPVIWPDQLRAVLDRKAS